MYRQIKYSLADMDLISSRSSVSRRSGQHRAAELQVTGGYIRFDSVTFGYQPERTILHDLQLEVPAGHKGCRGRSQRCRQVDAGTPGSTVSTTSTAASFRLTGRISARSARTVCARDRDSPAGHRAVQSVHLLTTSPTAAPDATHAEVERAAAMAHPRLYRGLPDGWDTVSANAD